MTVEEIKALALAMAATFTAQVQEFEAATGCIVHSLPIRPAIGKTPVMVEVKVQIP